MRVRMSPSRTGPFTLRMIWRFWSSRNLTRTWVTCGTKGEGREGQRLGLGAKRDGMGPISPIERGRTRRAAKDLSCASARHDARGGRETMRARCTYLTAGAGAADHFHDDGTAGGGGRGRWSADVRGGETLKDARLRAFGRDARAPGKPGATRVDAAPSPAKRGKRAEGSLTA